MEEPLTEGYYWSQPSFQILLRLCQTMIDGRRKWTTHATKTYYTCTMKKILLQTVEGMYTIVYVCVYLCIKW
jgi:hypothetical protein